MLILASVSPRRIELIKKITADFKVVEPHINEREVPSYSETLPRDIAKMKAYEVFRRYPEDTVIACDTIVYHKQRKLGKPHDEREAFEMLKSLSGQKHKVLTGLTIISKHVEISKTVVTDVTFNDLTDDLIREYVATGSPMDKAGSYGIQDSQYPIVKKIFGSYDNVMGFPTEEIRKLLIKYRLLSRE